MQQPNRLILSYNSFIQVVQFINSCKIIWYRKIVANGRFDQTLVNLLEMIQMLFLYIKKKNRKKMNEYV